MKKYEIVAVNYEGKELHKEFDSLTSGLELFDKLCTRRESIALYKSMEFRINNRPFSRWTGAVSFSQAREFYRDCLPFWHDGVISAKAIAERFNCPLGRVKLFLEACLAWGLPVSKANGKWAF